MGGGVEQAQRALPLRWKKAWSTSWDLDQCWNQMKLTFLVKAGYWRHISWKRVSALLMIRHTRQLLRTVLTHTHNSTDRMMMMMLMMRHTRQLLRTVLTHTQTIPLTG